MWAKVIIICSKLLNIRTAPLEGANVGGVKTLLPMGEESEKRSKPKISNHCIKRGVACGSEMSSDL